MKCPRCGYYAFNGYECFDCGYKPNRDDLIKFIRPMYPDKTEQQCFQRVEDLIKDDVYRPCELTCEEQERVNEAEKELVEEQSSIGGKTITISIADDIGWTEETECLTTVRQPVGAGKESQQSKFKPGDRVRVTDRIRHWVKKLGWTEDMLDHIGKIHTVNFHHVRYDEIFYSRSDVEMNCFELKGLLMAWPSDCLELVTD